MFKSATTPVEEVMSANIHTTDSCSSLPKLTSVAHAANRHHCKNRPKHAKTLDFEQLHEHIPTSYMLTCNTAERATWF